MDSFLQCSDIFVHELSLGSVCALYIYIYIFIFILYDMIWYVFVLFFKSKTHIITYAIFGRIAIYIIIKSSQSCRNNQCLTTSPCSSLCLWEFSVPSLLSMSFSTVTTLATTPIIHACQCYEANLWTLIIVFIIVFESCKSYRKILGNTAHLIDSRSHQ